MTTPPRAQPGAQPCADAHHLARRARHEFLAIVGLLVAAAANIGWFATLTLI